jgi:hypothetical protein
MTASKQDAALDDSADFDAITATRLTDIPIHLTDHACVVVAFAICAAKMKFDEQRGPDGVFAVQPSKPRRSADSRPALTALSVRRPPR